MRDLTPTELRYLDRDILAKRVAQLQAANAELAEQRDAAHFRTAELATSQRRPRRKTIALTDEMVNAVVLADSARAGLRRALELAGFTVTDDEVTTC